MPENGKRPDASISLLQLGHDRDGFLTQLAGELAGILQDVVGLDEADGFVSIVGQRLGSSINTEYKRALSVTQIPPEHLGEVLVDLKSRINGDFFLIEQSETRIVLGNRRCPFGRAVLGRSSLCMLTSNVFGSITSDNTGYAKVALEETIANGHNGCRVVIYLNRTAEAESARGREYFRPGA